MHIHGIHICLSMYIAICVYTYTCIHITGKAIVLHYVRTWMVFDIMLVGLDWYMVLDAAAAIYYTLYTLHFTLYTIHYTLYTIHYTLYTIHYTIHYAMLYYTIL